MGTAALSAYAIWRLRPTVTGLVGIGPYPVVVQHRWARILQRATINFTRVDEQVQLYPLNSLPQENPSRSNDNGHPVSGAVRDASRELITQAVNAAGCVKFELSPASRSYVGDPSAHQHYAPADLHLGVDGSEPGKNSIVVGIDIDYYLSDPHWYLGFGRPALFHTFHPVVVAGRDGESRFRIRDDEVQYEVSGGSAWSHGVWDWCAFGEFLEVPQSYTGLSLWYRALALIGVHKCHYMKVHYARPWASCPNRLLVWVLPQFSCYVIGWIGSDLRARRLNRVKYSDSRRPGWNSIVAVEPNGDLNVSLGRNGEDAAISLPKEHYDVLMGLSTAQSVTTRMLGLNHTKPFDLALFGQYYSGKPVDAGNAPRIGRPCQVTVHWPLACEADVPEVTARVYSSPLVSDHNNMPMIRRWETLSQSIDERITFVANDVVPPRRLQAYADEFVRLVVPHAGVGNPLSIEDVVLELDKPSQALAVKMVWETLDMEPRQLIEAFVKNEPTNKHGRIISSFADARFLIQFSRYTLAFRDQVFHAEHNSHWFCPGLTPNQIAEKVVQYVSEIGAPLEADFSNFDGTVSKWLQRHVMNASYRRYFGPIKELLTFTDMLIECPARAKRFGFRYEAGVGVKSGSPTTCDQNTNLNAYTQYCAIRITLPELTPEQAFRCIGLAFGDDILFEERFRSALSRVVNSLGMKIKCERYDARAGVTFLARVYPRPLESTTSFQDPLRTWRKLHITTRDPNVPLADAALDRLDGYLVTDRYSPITSNYCRMVRRRYLPIASPETQRLARKSSNKEKPYWLTAGGAWPQNPDDIEAMVQVTAFRTGMSDAQVRFIGEVLDVCEDVWAVFTINRSEYELVWKGTIMSDGGPSEPVVDLRNYERDVNTVQLRSGEGIAGQNQDVDRGSPQGVADSGRDRQVGPPRSVGVRRLPNQQRGQGYQGDRQSPGETEGCRLPQRRPVRRGGPGNSGFQVTQTVARPGGTASSVQRGGRRSGGSGRPAVVV